MRNRSTTNHPNTNRRAFLGCIATICGAGFAGCSADSTNPTPTPTEEPTPTVSPTQTPTPKPTAPNQGLEAYYPFDGDALTNQVTGTAATTEGTVTTGVEGVVGSAAKVQGENNPGITTENLPVNGPAATIACWWRYSSQSSYSRVFQVGGQLNNHPANGGYDVEFRETQEAIWLVVFEGDLNFTRSDPISVSPNTWYFVVSVVDGEQFRLHLFDTGGELDSSPVDGTGTRTQTDSPPVFFLGGGGDHPITGRVDEARIYSRALSPEDVATLYTMSGGSA